MGWFFSDYRVSPNFLVVLGLRLWLRLGLGCDNDEGKLGSKTQSSSVSTHTFTAHLQNDKKGFVFEQLLLPSIQ